MKILVTGGSGFIGSNFVRHVLKATNHTVLNIDKLTYAANPRSLTDIEDNPRYEFQQCDIVNAGSIRTLFENTNPDSVIHFAAESHVDRSISGPGDFIQTNVVGTYNLLNCSAAHFDALDGVRKEHFRFVHVSTDEVYGSLTMQDKAACELTRYSPSSPYSASKAASDHLALAWHTTFGLPVIITHSSNNYGAFQFPEKLIPMIITRALDRQPIPVYGDGKNIRDWLYVQDHVEALISVLANGRIGATYNIGSEGQTCNIDLVKQVCAILDSQCPIKDANIDSYADLIEFVTDRKGHDLRYALNTSRIRDELGWTPKTNLDAGLEATVQWYLANRDWWSGTDAVD